jgi:hypothetical protein
VKQQKCTPTKDEDKDAKLSVDELHRAVDHAGVNLSKSEIIMLMAMISTDGNDTVSNAEFMKARYLAALSGFYAGQLVLLVFTLRLTTSF